MKKVFLITALVLAVFSMRAQNPNVSKTEIVTDSVSVMLRHLANTNAEVQYINDNLRLHSQLALGSFALEALGGALIYLAYQNGSGWENVGYFGTAFCIAGGVGFLCSYIPIWSKAIKVDERGLVVSLNR